jgi:hypothetical protein
MAQPPALTADEQTLNDVWNEHLRAEFSAHSAEEALATMVAHPRVHQVPVMIGGEGRDEVYAFYAHYFLPQIPPDIQTIPVLRTIGQAMVLRVGSSSVTSAGDGRVQEVSQRNTFSVDHHHPLRPFAPLGFPDAGPPFLAGAKLPSANVSAQSSWP